MMFPAHLPGHNRCPDEDVATMISLAKEGHSTYRISRLVGRSRSCVAKYVKNAGISLDQKYANSSSIKDVRRIVELYESGLTQQEVAEKMGCSISTISYWTRYYFVERTRREVQEKRWEDEVGDIRRHMAALYDEGLTLREVAKITGRSYGMVQRAVAKYGQPRESGKALRMQYWSPRTRRGRKRQELVLEMARKYHEGASVLRLSREYGRSWNGVKKMLSSNLNPYPYPRAA